MTGRRKRRLAVGSALLLLLALDLTRAPRSQLTSAVLVGSALTARRLLRCGPWTPAGTVDPPPEMLD